MATVSFTKDITITEPEAVARFVEIISQPPKPISEDLGVQILNEKTEEGIELLKRLSSL